MKGALRKDGYRFRVLADYGEVRRDATNPRVENRETG